MALGPVAFFSVATVWMTRPFAWRAATHLAELCDSYLNVWILAWDVHALGTRPGRLFDANIFYPLRRTLALSEHMLGNLPVFAPIALATGNPVLGFNAVILSSFVLCGCTMAWLVHYYTGRVGPALAAGFVFAFVPFRITQLPHMQLLSLQWLPLAIYFADRLLREGGARAWIGFVAFTLWQCLVSYYLAYLTAVVLGAYGLVLAWQLRRSLPRRRLGAFGFAFVAVALVMVPLTLPYRRLQRDGAIPSFVNEQFIHQHEDAVALADPFWSYLSIPTDAPNVYHGLLTAQARQLNWEKSLFPGFVPVLTVLAAAVLRRRRSADLPVPAHARLALAAVLLAGYVCSLGPWLVWNDVNTWTRLPAYWLGRLVPGFSGIRAWTRFSMGAVLGLAGLFGIALAELTSRLSGGRRALVVTGVLLALAVEYNLAPLQLSEPPPIATLGHRWLAEHGDGGPLLILPGADIHGCQHAGYMYHTMAHWLPLATGYSGHSPPKAGWTIPIAQGLPEPWAVERAQRRGLRWLLLERTAMAPEQRARFDDALAAGTLVPAATFGDEVIFDLARLRP